MTRTVTRRWAQAAALAAGSVAFALGYGPASAQSGIVLVMIEEPGCPYCRRWEREVGRAYPNTPEGRFAPLVRRTKGDPAIAAIIGVLYSPTFIVMRGNAEVGRITGYPGADFFWPMLSEILTKAGFQPQAAAAFNATARHGVPDPDADPDAGRPSTSSKQ